MRDFVSQLQGGLIVSCQAYPGEPMRHPETMAQIALSAQLGGAAGIRCQGLADISAVKGQVSVPVIGLWKEGESGVYITPTLRHARCCMMSGADIVALDATSRPRPDGRTLRQTVDVLKEEGTVLMADCSCLDDALQAADLGFDFISTTLAGYTGGRPMSDEPDWGLLESMVDRLPNVPVICEGRIHTPRQARRARDIGAWAVVVGTAITHPRRVTSWFNAALHE
ncbi:N-acetylmannosamine-6-phosphate 2-epimerase [Bifidobacterium bifidum]|uniref:N-acetylmannosamine-6-phosphate 2-epimerase n=1 Tax=Bifidobacterium bifidum TaxID=1681 RepID=UPI003D06C5D1